MKKQIMPTGRPSGTAFFAAEEEANASMPADMAISATRKKSSDTTSERLRTIWRSSFRSTGLRRSSISGGGDLIADV